MAPSDQAILFLLSLGGLVATFHCLRISHEKAYFTCCKITEGFLHDNRKGEFPIRGKICKQHRTLDEKCKLDRIHDTGEPCTTYSCLTKEQYIVNEVETLDYKECKSAQWCGDVTFPKCYKIIEGALSPWGYRPGGIFPLGMALPVSGKVCQHTGHNPPTTAFLHRPLKRFAKLKIDAVELLGSEECCLGSEECEGDKWKHLGLEAAPECDDFGFWKQVLITEGIKAPNWQASIAAAKTLSSKGMAWGTTRSAEAADDTLWNARRDTVLGVDNTSSSWS